jgi:predicted TPR repeat methyltransferase
VNKLLKAAGFTQIQVETRALRLEAGEPVQGFVVTAQK